jgi:hypothetical protein
MNTASLAALVGCVIGTALLFAALSLARQPRQRRLILAYMGALFYVYAALEFFGIIHLERM